jgi:DNA-binding NarL/FixJ family response regulator
MTTDQVTIVVAEDHPLYRRALTALLGEQPGWSSSPRPRTASAR